MSHTSLLDDLVDLEVFASEVDRDPRTVRRWMTQADGLPYTRLGNRVLVHGPTAREWILGRMHRPAARRSAARNPAVA
jgi:hypothetical protein